MGGCTCPACKLPWYLGWAQGSACAKARRSRVEASHHECSAARSECRAILHTSRKSMSTTWHSIGSDDANTDLP